jgi:hypothetical protein
MARSRGSWDVAADRGQADAAVLAESAHHVEHDTRLACLVEMDLVAGDDVEQIVVGDPAKQRRIEVVGRDHVFLAPARSGEEGCDGVVASAGEELEGQRLDHEQSEVARRVRLLLRMGSPTTDSG